MAADPAWVFTRSLTHDSWKVLRPPQQQGPPQRGPGAAEPRRSDTGSVELGHGALPMATVSARPLRSAEPATGSSGDGPARVPGRRAGHTERHHEVEQQPGPLLPLNLDTLDLRGRRFCRSIERAARRAMNARKREAAARAGQRPGCAPVHPLLGSDGSRFSQMPRTSRGSRQALGEDRNAGRRSRRGEST
jgi:hypothetical protein